MGGRGVMAEDNNFEKDKNGKPIELEKIMFEEWQIKLLRKLKEWFPDG